MGTDPVNVRFDQERVYTLVIVSPALRERVISPALRERERSRAQKGIGSATQLRVVEHRISNVPEEVIILIVSVPSRWEPQPLRRYTFVIMIAKEYVIPQFDHVPRTLTSAFLTILILA